MPVQREIAAVFFAQQRQQSHLRNVSADYAQMHTVNKQTVVMNILRTRVLLLGIFTDRVSEESNSIGHVRPSVCMHSCLLNQFTVDLGILCVCRS